MAEGHAATVVVATDGSSRSAGAVRFAALRAQQEGLPLRVVHVVPDHVPLADLLTGPTHGGAAGPGVAGRLRATSLLVAGTAPDVDVRTSVLVGGRVPQLVAASRDARLLVLGHETRGAAERLLFGTTTLSVVAGSEVAACVVPQDWVPDGVVRPVVAGLAARGGIPSLLDAAFRAAALTGQPLVVVHAWDLPSPYAEIVQLRVGAVDWVEDARKQLERLVEPWHVRYPTVRVSVEVVHEVPHRALLGAARRASLLVLLRGTRARALLRLGPTARAVLARAPVPVLLAPAPRDAGASERSAAAPAGAPAR